MQKPPLPFIGRYAVIAAVIVGVAGCGGSEIEKKTDDAHIKQVAVLYGQCIGHNRGKPPADEKSFRAFVQNTLTARQSADTVDAVLTSPRDNEPYVIRYGILAGPDAPTVVVYEKTGKRGKRFVGMSHGGTEEVDEKKFKELVPNG